MNEPSIESKLHELFAQALALPPHDRASFIEQHCTASEAEELQRRLNQADGDTHSIFFAPTDPIPHQPKRPGSIAAKSFDDPKIDGYEIESQLGRGGMGVVYRAKHRDTNRTVALKIIRPDKTAHLDDGDQNSAIDRFRTEALAAAKLDHANIVTVYDVGEHEGLPYYAMRFVDGESLAEMAHAAPLPSRQAAEYLELAARALHDAHESGVLHRDLKPHNIMIDRKTDQALLADFGLAKLREGGQSATLSGEVFGSPPYMSPEQATDAAGVTEATDIYGLGATLYHVLTGKPPFQGVNAPQTLKQVLEQEPVAPRELNPDIDRDLETICLKCLEKDRVRRYRTAEELADDLRRYLNDQTIMARPAGRVERFRKFSRRNKAFVFGVTGTITALTLGLIGTGLGMFYAIKAKGEAEQLNSKNAALVGQLNEKVVQLQKKNQETNIQAGDLAAQRGQWRTAVASYDRALADDPVGQIPLRIKRTRSLISAMETQAARAEAEAILTKATDETRAEALLLMGEAEATRFDSKDKGVGYYRQALESGQLNAADELYVKAVLSLDVFEAIRLAEAAIKLDPFRKDANEFLVVLYAMSGQRQKLSDHVQVLKGSFPEDANYVFLDAILLVLDGQTKQAFELVKSMKGRVADAELAATKEHLLMMSQMLDVLQAAAEGDATLAQLFPVLQKADKLASMLGRSGKGQQLSPLNNVTAYPVMQPLVDIVPSLSLRLLTIPSSTRNDVERLLKQYPMHELHLMHGELCFSAAMSTSDADRTRDNLVQCEQSCQTGLEIDQMITRLPPLTRLTALGAQMELIFWKQLKDEQEIAAMKERARNNVLAFINILANPNHRWHDWTYKRVWMVIAGAIGTGNYDEARNVARLWLKKAPDDAQAHEWLARIEVLDGHAVAAIESADRAIALDANREKAKQSREHGLRMLGEAFEKFKDRIAATKQSSDATETSSDKPEAPAKTSPAPNDETD